VWIHLAQDREWWWALVNTPMNPQVLMPQLVSFQNKLFSVIFYFHFDSETKTSLCNLFTH
jgi:hypothetical protein